MLNTILYQRHTKTILIALVMIAFLVVSAAAKNDQRVNVQDQSRTSEVFKTSEAYEPAAAPAVTPHAPRTIQYTYDNAGRLTNVNYVGAQSIAYTYDAAGNLIQETGGSRKYVYLPLILKSAP
jgi:YD repeat-containing protein